MFTYLRCKISNEDEKDPCWVGPLSPQHGVSSGYGWRVAVNILNKQSQTAEKGWSSSLGIGRAARNSSQWKTSLLRSVTHGRKNI